MRKFEQISIRYLEMIQGVISRMGSNSFALKGWTVTLVAGILALSSALTDKTYVLVALVPVVVFWSLDAYYLQLERQYRALFNHVRETQDAPIDFDLRLKENAVWMKGNDTLMYSNCYWSPSEKWFYLPLGAVVLILLILTEVMVHAK